VVETLSVSETGAMQLQLRNPHLYLALRKRHDKQQVHAHFGCRQPRNRSRRSVLDLERGWNVVAEPAEAAIGKVIELQPE
jgi:hypothetical protein